VKEVEDGVGVFVRGFGGGEGLVDHGGEGGVEWLGGVEEGEVLGRAVVFLAADLGFGAVALALEPGGVFAAGAVRGGGDRDELVAVHGCLDLGAVAESGCAESRANGWVETLEEA
jgi:hypothetical protein